MAVNAVNGGKIVMRHYFVMVPSRLLAVFFYCIDSGYVWQWFTGLCTAILLVCLISVYIMLVANDQFSVCC